MRRARKRRSIQNPGQLIILGSKDRMSQIPSYWTVYFPPQQAKDPSEEKSTYPRMPSTLHHSFRTKTSWKFCRQVNHMLSLPHLPCRPGSTWIPVTVQEN